MCGTGGRADASTIVVVDAPDGRIMPLDHGYGVLVGALAGHHRDQPDDQGRWYHVHLTIQAGGAAYEAAIDVDSKQSATGVQWKVVRATTSDLGPAAALADGFHLLASTNGSGALDHIRHPIAALLRWRWTSPGCCRRFPPWLQRFPLLVYQPWKSGNHLDATIALEGILAAGATVLVWGEPFTPPDKGVHNVHQNQGDPAGSQWWAENGIWQDGAVGVQAADGSYRVFLSKFSSQASKTDASGHPA